MIGSVVNLGLWITNDDDTGGDKAAGILGSVKQHWQHTRKINLVGVNVLL